MKARQAKIKRITGETAIQIQLNVDGSGKSSIRTGVPFFDHMLTLFAKHAVVDLKLVCKGDLEVDAHHTVEDCGIALGQAFYQALGDKRGIRRYGAGFDPRNPFTGEAHVPMDECLARCVIDFSGRPYFVWRGLDNYSQRAITLAERRQDMSSAFRFGLAREFFQGFTNEARCNLHIELLYHDYNAVGAFAAASILAVLAIVTLIAKVLLERQGAGRISRPGLVSPHTEAPK